MFYRNVHRALKSLNGSPIKQHCTIHSAAGNTSDLCFTILACQCRRLKSPAGHLESTSSSVECYSGVKVHDSVKTHNSERSTAIWNNPQSSLAKLYGDVISFSLLLKFFHKCKLTSDGVWKRRDYRNLLDLVQFVLGKFAFTNQLQENETIFHTFVKIPVPK